MTQNFPLFIYLYILHMCFIVDKYVCATDDSGILHVCVVKKNVHYSVTYSHPHNINLGPSCFQSPCLRRYYFLVECNPTGG
jgi:hypothetical protein